MGTAPVYQTYIINYITIMFFATWDAKIALSKPCLTLQFLERMEIHAMCGFWKNGLRERRQKSKVDINLKDIYPLWQRNVDPDLL